MIHRSLSFTVFLYASVRPFLQLLEPYLAMPANVLRDMAIVTKPKIGLLIYSYSGRTPELL